MQISEAQAMCKKHVHRYVLVRTKDGMSYDGIVESVDESNVYLAIPIGTANTSAQVTPQYASPQSTASGCGCGGNRAVGYYPGYYGSAYPGYGYGYGTPGYGYGYGPGYGYGYYPGQRRFQRLVLPLAALTAISLLPYF